MSPSSQRSVAALVPAALPLAGPVLAQTASQITPPSFSPPLQRGGGLGPDGVLRVSDPRFDAPLVCTGRPGGGFLARPAPAPGPQARRPAAAR